uniref:Ig-like domain-containing protein n=1 Tax=Callorhinchus milii TaxID=7868 RepID=A0A4W3H5S1_CALMI
HHYKQKTQTLFKMTLSCRYNPDPFLLCSKERIFPRDSERDSKSLILVCETAEFYPGDVTLTWNKDGNEVKTEIDFTEEKNSKGLYKASSSMEDTQPNGVVYLCLVSHISLRVPAVVKFTVSNPTGGLVFLLLLIIVGKQFNCKCFLLEQLI